MATATKPSPTHLKDHFDIQRLLHASGRKPATPAKLDDRIAADVPLLQSALATESLGFSPSIQCADMSRRWPDIPTDVHALVEILVSQVQMASRAAG
jgi:hypothetical protein